MSRAAYGLRIRFGLQHEPTDAEVKQWADLVKLLIGQGYSVDIAGGSAAKAIFRDYNTVVYASEADTIEALLRLAGAR